MQAAGIDSMPLCCRFSLLLLEFAEIYFEDYSVIYYWVDGEGGATGER